MSLIIRFIYIKISVCQYCRGHWSSRTFNCACNQACRVSTLLTASDKGLRLTCNFVITREAQRNKKSASGFNGEQEVIADDSECY
jgi:hypothetical protein